MCGRWSGNDGDKQEQGEGSEPGQHMVIVALGSILDGVGEARWSYVKLEIGETFRSVLTSAQVKIDMGVLQCKQKIVGRV